MLHWKLEGRNEVMVFFSCFLDCFMMSDMARGWSSSHPPQNGTVSSFSRFVGGKGHLLWCQWFPDTSYLILDLICTSITLDYDLGLSHSRGNLLIFKLPGWDSCNSFSSETVLQCSGHNSWKPSLQPSSANFINIQFPVLNPILHKIPRVVSASCNWTLKDTGLLYGF